MTEKRIEKIEEKEMKEESLTDKESPLDLDVINSLKKLGPSDGRVLKNILTTYFKSYEKQKQELERAFKEPDMTLISDIAHKIKGSSGTIGARHISELAKQIENDIENKNLPGAKANYEELTKKTEELKVYVEREYFG